MIREGELLWTPSADWIANSNIAKFIRWLNDKRGLTFRTDSALWTWSVTETEAFWSALWDYFSIQSSVPYERILATDKTPGAKWFPGTRLNYAQHVLRQSGREQTRCCLCRRTRFQPQFRRRISPDRFEFLLRSFVSSA